MVDIEDLEKFNPWWKTGSVKEDWLKTYKRQLYFELEKYLEKRQILLIWGLRRLGKTTLMLQLVQNLLKTKDVSPKNILYFSFDELSFDLKDVLNSYQKLILGKTLEEEHEGVYVFLDEVQKVKDWENRIKVYYDLYPNVKFFLSGSASVGLRRRSKESLAGRIFDFVLDPLNFEEFLELRGLDLGKVKENPDLWKREILPHFYHYMKFGMFPELVGEMNAEVARNYLLNNVIDRILYKDLPEEFGLKDVELLKSLAYIVGKNPGLILNYTEISKNLGRDQRTIANYFEYLEFGLLIKFVFNYRGSPLASMRKMKKAYLATPNLAMVFNPNLERALPQMLENVVLNKTGAKFFYRNGFEVDFVLQTDNNADELIAIEVKKNEKDAKQIRKFVSKFGKRVKEKIIVDLETDGKIDDIEIIPAWKFLLLKHFK